MWGGVLAALIALVGAVPSGNAVENDILLRDISPERMLYLRDPGGAPPPDGVRHRSVVRWPAAGSLVVEAKDSDQSYRSAMRGDFIWRHRSIAAAQEHLLAGEHDKPLAASWLPPVPIVRLTQSTRSARDSLAVIYIDGIEGGGVADDGPWKRADIVDTVIEVASRASFIDVDAAGRLNLNLHPGALLAYRRIQFVAHDDGLIGTYARPHTDQGDANDGRPERNPIVSVALGVLGTFGIAWVLWGLIMTRPERFAGTIRHGVAVLAGRAALMVATVLFLLSVL